MRRFLPLIFLLFALSGYGFLLPEVWENRQQARDDTPAGYIIPSKFSRILALGHQGLLSDYLFLKIATFVGGHSAAAGNPMLEDDWQYLSRSLDVVTDLDPYFLDPYMLAEGLLAWDAQKISEANNLLEKGARYRTWDWKLPFFVGFNHFYFSKDYEAASSYIMQAAQMPGSPAYLKTLGARLAYYGGKSKTALLFLKEMLAETDDALLRNRLQLRLQALESAVAIEEALDRYRKREGRLPNKVADLLTSGDLLVLPPDPYGGEWRIFENGRVLSTSKFAKPKNK